MTYRVTTALLLGAALGAVATAQTVVPTVSALQPLLVTSTSGTTQQNSVPAGPLPAFGNMSVAAAYGVNADLTWSVVADDTMAVAAFGHGLSILSGSQGSVSVGPLDYVVTFTAATTVSATLSLTRVDNMSGGAQLATVSMDIDNDGSFEVNLGSANPIVPTLATVGPAGRQVRVRIDNQLGTVGFSHGQVALTMRPANDLDVFPAAVGCVQAAQLQLSLLPVFTNRGIAVRADNTFSSDLAAIVIGIAQQPVLLPSQNGLPCLLVPSPDFVALALPAQISSVTIGLPASVRPLDLYAQVVQIGAGLQLATSDAFRVSAY